MKKTSIYTAISLSLLSSTLIASANDDEHLKPPVTPVTPVTPVKVAQEMALEEKKGRFDGMTPGTEKGARAHMKKTLMRQFRFDEDVADMQKAQSASDAAYDELQQLIKKLSLEKRTNAAQVAELKAKNQALEEEKATAKTKILAEQKALEEIQQKVTQLETDAVKNADELSTLKKSAGGRATFIKQLQDSYDELEKAFDKQATLLKKTEEKHKARIDTMNDEITKLQTSGQPQSSSNSNQYPSSFNKETDF